MRYVHRIASFVACLLLLWLGATGTLVESIDLYKHVARAPESDKVVQSINSHIYGNPDYSVVTESDLSARPFPRGFDYAAAFTRLSGILAERSPNLRPQFVEIRVDQGRPIGQAGLVALKPFKIYPVNTFDLASGSRAAPVALPVIFPPPFSARDYIKNLHRFWFTDDKLGGWIEILCGILLWCLILTGLTVYFRLLSFRTKKLKRGAWFWRGGSLWIVLHRWTSVGAALFLIVLATSGTLLGIETAYHSIAGKGLVPEVRALTDADIRDIAGATLAALRRDEPETAVRVIRLRYYNGMRQGVVITAGPPTRQLVYNVATGKTIGFDDPGLPMSKFPFGSTTHLVMQEIHSGEIVGIPLIFMNLLAALSLAFLSISGIVIYVSMWRKRAKGGRRQLIWK